MTYTYPNIKHLTSMGLCLLGLSGYHANASAQTSHSSKNDLEEVIVTAEFGEASPLEIANSVSVYNESDINKRGAQHLEQLLNLSPNVNFAGGASRGRFIQVRGIGEQGQFAEPLIASVGVLIDGIDFTGISTAATTMDIQQVEILRGPQGTLYGANALAGLINLVSNKPTKETTGRVSATIGNYDALVFSGVLSGPINEQAGYRIAMQSNQSDGYITNDTLGRDDTSGIDETTMRGKILWENDTTSIDLTGFYADIKNKYDAFSLDQNRTTLSDEPGQDEQKTKAISVVTAWSGADNFNVEALVSYADSDLDYGYDEDWSPLSFVDDYWGYSSFDRYLRDRQNASFDIRFLSNDDGRLFNQSMGWVVGLYLRTQDEDLRRERTGAPVFTSQYETDNVAIYTQLRTELTDRWVLLTGLRLEQRSTSYKDNDGGLFSPDENLWGGKLSLEYTTTNDTLVYATLSRGYKSGGVNSNSSIPVTLRDYDTEFLLNYELGIKGQWLDNDALTAQLVLFYQDRKDVQVGQSIFESSTFTFNDYLENSAGGNTAGVELELSYEVNSSFKLFATLGLLDATFDDFTSSTHVDARNDFTGEVFEPVKLDGRDLAYAPNYQYVIGGIFNLSDDMYIKIDVEGKDAYFYSNTHENRSDSYSALLNVSIGYNINQVELSLWGRNLTDEDYGVQGFYFSNQFGNDPRDGYAPNTYEQYGEPRVVGLSASYNF